MAQYSSVNSWFEDVERSLDKNVRGVKIAVFNQVVNNTRVDTGRMRANWIPTNNVATRVPIDATDPSGGATNSKINQVVVGINADSFLSNNLEYTPIWNETDGYIDLAKAYFRSVIRKVRKDGGLTR